MTVEQIVLLVSVLFSSGTALGLIKLALDARKLKAEGYGAEIQNKIDLIGGAERALDLNTKQIEILTEQFIASNKRIEALSGEVRESRDEIARLRLEVALLREALKSLDPDHPLIKESQDRPRGE